MAKETYNFKELTNRSHPIPAYVAWLIHAWHRRLTSDEACLVRDHSKFNVHLIADRQDGAEFRDYFYKNSNEPEFGPWDLRLVPHINGTNHKSHENPGTPGTKLKVFRNNLKMLCHPICNQLYIHVWHDWFMRDIAGSQVMRRGLLVTTPYVTYLIHILICDITNSFLLEWHIQFICDMPHS